MRHKGAIGGKVYGHGEGNQFSFTSVNMPAGMEARYRLFKVEQPFDTGRLPPSVLDLMGCRAGKVALTGEPGSEARLSGYQHFESLWVSAPEGRFSIEELTRTAFRQAKRDKKAYLPQACLEPNPRTGTVIVDQDVYIAANHIEQIGGSMVYGGKCTYSIDVDRLYR